MECGDKVRFTTKYSCENAMCDIYDMTTVGYGDGMFDEYLAFVRGEKEGRVTAMSFSRDGTPIVRLGTGLWYMQRDLEKVPGTETEII